MIILLNHKETTYISNYQNRPSLLDALAIGINGILPARQDPSNYATVLIISPGQQFSTAGRRTHGNGGNTAGTVLLRTPKTYDQARNLRPRSAGKPTGF